MIIYIITQFGKIAKTFSKLSIAFFRESAYNASIKRSITAKIGGK